MSRWNRINLVGLNLDRINAIHQSDIGNKGAIIY
jgi:hypothetical protein